MATEIKDTSIQNYVSAQAIRRNVGEWSFGFQSAETPSGLRSLGTTLDIFDEQKGREEVMGIAKHFGLSLTLRAMEMIADPTRERRNGKKPVDTSYFDTEKGQRLLERVDRHFYQHLGEYFNIDGLTPQVFFTQASMIARDTFLYFIDTLSPSLLGDIQRPLNDTTVVTEPGSLLRNALGGEAADLQKEAFVLSGLILAAAEVLGYIRSPKLPKLMQTIHGLLTREIFEGKRGETEEKRIYILFDTNNRVLRLQTTIPTKEDMQAADQQGNHWYSHAYKVRSWHDRTEEREREITRSQAELHKFPELQYKELLHAKVGSALTDVQLKEEVASVLKLISEAERAKREGKDTTLGSETLHDLARLRIIVDEATSEDDPRVLAALLDTVSVVRGAFGKAVKSVTYQKRVSHDKEGQTDEIHFWRAAIYIDDLPPIEIMSMDMINHLHDQLLLGNGFEDESGAKVPAHMGYNLRRLRRLISILVSTSNQPALQEAAGITLNNAQKSIREETKTNF